MEERNSVQTVSKSGSIVESNKEYKSTNNHLESIRRNSIAKVEELLKSNQGQSYIPGQNSVLYNKKKTIDRLNSKNKKMDINNVKNNVQNEDYCENDSVREFKLSQFNPRESLKNYNIDVKGSPTSLADEVEHIDIEIDKITHSRKDIQAPTIPIQNILSDSKKNQKPDSLAANRFAGSMFSNRETVLSQNTSPTHKYFNTNNQKIDVPNSAAKVRKKSRFLEESALNEIIQTPERQLFHEMDISLNDEKQHMEMKGTNLEVTFNTRSQENMDIGNLEGNNNQNRLKEGSNNENHIKEESTEIEDKQLALNNSIDSFCKKKQQKLENESKNSMEEKPPDSLNSSNMSKKFPDKYGLIKKAFDFYDADNSGALDEKELNRLIFDICHNLGHQFSKDKFLDCYRIIDENQDGEIQFVELLTNLDKIYSVLKKEYTVSEKEMRQLAKRKPKDMSRMEKCLTKRFGEEITAKNKKNCDILASYSDTDGKELFNEYMEGIEAAKAIKKSLYSQSPPKTETKSFEQLINNPKESMGNVDIRGNYAERLVNSIKKQKSKKNAVKKNLTTSFCEVIKDESNQFKENPKNIGKVAEDVKNKIVVPKNTEIFNEFYGQTCSDKNIAGDCFGENFSSGNILDTAKDGNMSQQAFYTSRDRGRHKSAMDHYGKITNKFMHFKETGFTNKFQKNPAKCIQTTLDKNFLKLCDSFLNNQKKIHFFDKYDLTVQDEMIKTGKNEQMKLNSQGNSISTFIKSAIDSWERRKTLIKKTSFLESNKQSYVLKEDWNAQKTIERFPSLKYNSNIENPIKNCILPQNKKDAKTMLLQRSNMLKHISKVKSNQKEYKGRRVDYSEAEQEAIKYYKFKNSRFSKSRNRFAESEINISCRRNEESFYDNESENPNKNIAQKLIREINKISRQSKSFHLEPQTERKGSETARNQIYKQDNSKNHKAPLTERIRAIEKLDCNIENSFFDASHLDENAKARYQSLYNENADSYRNKYKRKFDKISGTSRNIHDKNYREKLMHRQKDKDINDQEKVLGEFEKKNYRGSDDISAQYYDNLDFILPDKMLMNIHQKIHETGKEKDDQDCNKDIIMQVKKNFEHVKKADGSEKKVVDNSK